MNAKSKATLIYNAVPPAEHQLLADAHHAPGRHGLLRLRPARRLRRRRRHQEEEVGRGGPRSRRRVGLTVGLGLPEAAGRHVGARQEVLGLAEPHGRGRGAAE